MAKSLREKVKPNLIRRRLDSFFLGNYSKKAFHLMLRLDRVMRDGSIEFDRTGEFKEYLNFSSVEEVEKFLKNFDSNIDSLIGIPHISKVDTLRRKKPKNK